MLHPCFESPFFVPEPQIAVKNEQFIACYTRRYVEEGYWNSGGAGMRGRVGAHHRMISTYLNALINAGFQIRALEEPHLPKHNYESIEDQWFSQIPRLLLVEAVKS